MDRLKVLSLFSGCGGMDLGILGNFKYLNQNYHKLPTEIVYAIDNDPSAVEIYNANFQHNCLLGDIKTINEKELPNHDILMGGFPCQSFSIVAQNPPRLGIKDEKGQLFFEICRILKEKQPRFFIAENVKGILSANQKRAFPLIIQEFQKVGYNISYQVFNASDYGIPQKRERVFIIGFKHFEDCFKFQFPQPITTRNKIPLKLVLDEQIEDKYFFSQKAVDGMLKAKETMNKGRVQNIDEPCNTISAHLAKVSLNSTDPVLKEGQLYRRFTPRETARIQSFPDNFRLDVVSENRQYKAIGNAVPPVLMWHISQQIINLIVEEEKQKYSLECA
ncbi:DNA-cytosine methyltransferase [Geminocystis sp. NIES-3708]|uniref:DNA (cytosine-5-)-methyltransferase n=1 Tax=Geminocystis sp. NIES-3708 TaxID=1615909 RepID=UPI0005FC9368|nr:DNA (cytosine-5-)-methyltransferase [Geminocystis sp. NIES-3708]BAQ62935.1 DNA-cytosine methyltransferase [Geminocystis sp. NIES-3708]